MNETKKGSKGSNIRNSVRMGFLAQWMALKQVNIEELADRAGKNRMSIYRWFAMDDAKVQDIKDFLKANGALIQIRIVPKNVAKTKMATDRYLMKMYPTHEIIDETALGFLRAFLALQGITMSDVARALELNLSTVATWFKNDNTHLSNIEMIAEKFDCEYTIRILRDPDYVEDPTIAKRVSKKKTVPDNFKEAVIEDD